MAIAGGLALAPFGVAVPRGATALVVAADLRVALDVAAAAPDDFEAWLGEQRALPRRREALAAWEAAQARCQSQVCGGGGSGGEVACGEEANICASAAAPDAATPLPPLLPPLPRPATALGHASSPCLGARSAPGSRADSPAGLDPASSASLSRRSLLPAAAQHLGSSAAAVASGIAGAVGASQRSLMRAVVAGAEAVGVVDAGGALSSGAGGRRLHRGAIQYRPPGRSLGAADGTALFDTTLLLRAAADGGGCDGAGSGACGALAATGLDLLSQALASASRSSHSLAAALFARLYHLRPPQSLPLPVPPPPSLASHHQQAPAPPSLRPPFLVRGDVDCGGHTLICGAGTPPEALLLLLAPLRSRALPRRALAPVVILDEPGPRGDGDGGGDGDGDNGDGVGGARSRLWDEVARLDGVLFVRGSARRACDLRRANAERAARAVVLAPSCIVAGGGSSDEDAEWEATALADAGVAAVRRRLLALNAAMEVACDVALPSSMRALHPLGALLEPRGGGGAGGGGSAGSDASAATPGAIEGSAVAADALVDSIMCQVIGARESRDIGVRLLWVFGSVIVELHTSKAIVSDRPYAALARVVPFLSLQPSLPLPLPPSAASGFSRSTTARPTASSRRCSASGTRPRAAARRPCSCPPRRPRRARQHSASCSTNCCCGAGRWRSRSCAERRPPAARRGCGATS